MRHYHSRRQFIRSAMMCAGCVTALPVIGCSSRMLGETAGRSSPASGSVLDVDNDAALRAILRRRVELEKRAVGMAVCVVRPDRTRIVAFGRARRGNDQLVAPDTVFEIGSITKVFTALLLADMVRSGEVKLDDPLARHLPSDFHVPKFSGRQIMLSDLATHTSGLPRFPALEGKPLSPEWMQAMTRFSTEDLRAWLAKAQPEPEARGGWWYSNVGYTLLSMALGHRAGRPYKTLLQERVIGPLGLHDTTFDVTAAMKRRLAEGHDVNLKPIPPTDNGIFIGGGGLYSTPNDLSRFAAAIVAGSSSRIAQDNNLLLTVRRPAGPWFHGVQALGWEIRDAPGGAFVTKDGVTWSQAVSMVFDPDRRLAVVVFSNTFPDLGYSTLSGGGIGAADLAQHLLRPQIPLDGGGGSTY
jgi:serine-type D-Ala-D-Ala carboxypeptidase/endopeptidase